MLGNFCKVAVIAAGIAASSIGVARAADQELPADVVAAAKKEGKVAFYTSFFGAKAHLDIIKTLRGEVRHQRRAARRARQRDDRAHPHRADLEALHRRRRAERRGKPHPPAARRASSRSMAASPTRRTCSRITRPAIRRADLHSRLRHSHQQEPVKGDDEPKSWQDLKNPKWKGKIISDDPRALGGGNVMFSAFQDKLGDDLQRRAGAAGTDAEPRRRQRRAPRRARRISDAHSAAVLELAGAEVAAGEVRRAGRGLPYIRFDFGVLNGAPHPNAARLFINHYLSEQVQTAYA